MNFPLGPGDVYLPNCGLFRATNLPLVTNIFFAYKIMGNQARYILEQLPGWVTTERFDIQARAEGNPHKDVMRTLMRALLADRFNLAVHNETREVPVLALVLSKPGKMGSHLRSHSEDPACATNLPPSVGTNVATVSGGFPALCNAVFPMPVDGPTHLHFGGRNVTIGVGFIADSLSMRTDLDRPLIDQTGITGAVDFTLEWARQFRRPVQLVWIQDGAPSC